MSSSSGSTEPLQFFCHTCQRKIAAVFHPRENDSAASSTSTSAAAASADDLDDQPTCPHCGDCFVERLEEDESMTPTTASSTTTSTTSSSTTTQTTPAPALTSSPFQNHPFMMQQPQVFQQTFHFPGVGAPMTQQSQQQQQGQQQQMPNFLQQLFGGMMQPFPVQPQQSQSGSAATTTTAGAANSPDQGDQLLPSLSQPQVQSFSFNFPPLGQQLFIPNTTGQANANPNATTASGSQPQAQSGNTQPTPQQQQQQFNQFQMFNPFAQLLGPMQGGGGAIPIQIQTFSSGPGFGGMPGAMGGGGGNPLDPLGGLLQQILNPLAGVMGAVGGNMFGGLPPNGQHQSDYFFGDFNQLLHSLMMQGGRTRSPPASAAVVAALQDITLDATSLAASANSDCSVCLENFAVGDVVKQLPCRHTYHPDCLLPWLKEHNSCPTCRYLLPTDDPNYEARRVQTSQAAAQAQVEQRAQVEAQAAAASQQQATTPTSQATVRTAASSTSTATAIPSSSTLPTPPTPTAPISATSAPSLERLRDLRSQFYSSSTASSSSSSTTTSSSTPSSSTNETMDVD